MKHAVNMLVPSHSSATAERFRDARNRSKRTESQLKCSGKIRGAVWIRQREGLFFAESKLLGVFVVGDVAASSLRSEPFTQISLICLSGFGELSRAHGASGECLVESQFFTDDHHSAVHGGAKIGYELSDELIELIHVKSWGGSLKCAAHIRLSLSFFCFVVAVSRLVARDQRDNTEMPHRAKEYAICCTNWGCKCAHKDSESGW